MDYQAHSPTRTEAKQAIVEAMELIGNPSSPHAAGRKARAALEDARGQIAQFCGARGGNVIFTSSGTEANALALKIGGNIGQSPSCFISAVEHISVFANAPSHRLIEVNQSGVVCLEKLEQQLAQADRPFVSVQLANHETGVIQPIGKIASLVKARGGFIHCDAVQAAGKIPLDMAGLNLDAITLSAHKVGAPSGTGALVLADEVSFEPLIKGGAQEFGQRAGTENLIGILAFAAALRLTSDKPLAEWRNEIEAALPQEAVIFGKEVERLDNTSSFALPNLSAQKALILFDMAGIHLSAGAACSSGKLSASPTLLAQGLSLDFASRAVRLSLGWQNQPQDIAYFIKTMKTICAQHANDKAQAATQAATQAA